MADINVERKRRGGILPWILGLLGLGLLLWLLSRLLGGDDDTPAVAPDTVAAALAAAPAAAPVAVPVDPAAGAGTGEGGAIPVAQIVGSPQSYAGRQVSGTARVTEVVSDHGFWWRKRGSACSPPWASAPSAPSTSTPGRRCG